MFSLKLDINCEFLLFENGFKGQWIEKHAWFQVDLNKRLQTFNTFNTCDHV